LSDTDQAPEVQIIDEPQAEQEIRNEIQQARALIPVGNHGVTPANFAQMVDFAKTMTLARNAIPQHLRGNAGDCLAIIDISAKVGLSPYMVANKTYVQNGRLCFESQLFHAFAQASGLLRGDLSVKYEGEGENLVCIVSGYLRNDPELKVHKSPPLKDVRPKRNEQGVVKGSPLWDKKPRVQLFYDTSRDWVRIYAPRATLGIYTPDEMQDHEEHFGDGAKIIDLKEQFRGADRSEGHKPGHVDAELANVARNTNAAPQPAEPEKEKKEKKKPGRKAAAKKADPKPKAGAKEKAEPKADKAGPPKTAAQYVVYANRWIEKETDGDNAAARWDGEYDMRTELAVPISDRNALQEKIEKKFGSRE